MSSPFYRLSLRRRMIELATAVRPDGEWSWPVFEARVGTVLDGVQVRCVAVQGFQSGKLTGIAYLSEDHSQALIAYPAAATRIHRIHLCGHEVWHLVEGHSCGLCDQCFDDLTRCAECERHEREAEQFAFLLGKQVALRSSRAARQSFNLAEAFGAVGPRP